MTCDRDHGAEFVAMWADGARLAEVCRDHFGLTLREAQEALERAQRLKFDAKQRYARRGYQPAQERERDKSRIFCTQCDSLVFVTYAQACRSSFCKAKGALPA